MSTPERIRTLRASGLGFWEARAIVEREELVEAIAKANSLDDIKACLLRMIK